MVQQSVTPPAPVTGSHNYKIYFADSAIAQGKLVSVLDRFKPNIEPVWLVYPQTRHLTPTVRAFVDFMAAQLRSRQTKS
jgi:LysR family transcriptional regulator, regulator for bpeEF and oprC